MSYIIFTGFQSVKLSQWESIAVSSIFTFILFTSVVFFVTIKISDMILFTAGASTFSSAYKRIKLPNPAVSSLMMRLAENM